MTRLSHYAAQSLQRQILDGHYRVGDMLPSQRELATTLGISRASLREAVSTLEALGLVRSQPGKGVFVTAGRNVEPAALPAGPGDQHPAEMFQFRAVVEPAAAALAASRIGTDGLAQLEAIQRRMYGALEKLDLVDASDADLAFHLAIARLSGNAPLAGVIQQYEQAIAHSLRLPFAETTLIWDPLDEHEAVLAAIRRHDTHAAYQAMLRHLQCAAARIGLTLSPLDLPNPPLLQGVPA
jgi:GntR family transcriptional repressor for pyruvate dehydrogenase complex